MNRRTRIVCTLGPASSEPATIAAMIRAGMDVVRLNTSHGDLAAHAEMVARVRSVAKAEGRHIAVLMDLGGPKMRTGMTTNGQPVEFADGATVTVIGRPELTTPAAIGVDYPGLVSEVQVGDNILLDDGNLELVVRRVSDAGLECHVLHGGQLGGRKGVSLPQSRISLPALTDRDRAAIAAGVAAGVDFFALSFVGDANDLRLARSVVTAHHAATPIIAKIERRLAIANLDEILAEADGVMVARGDLGVELLPEDVPVEQRKIIAGAGQNMIPVITATQMLESMITSSRPTRAEASDVANAVWGLSDALMLSGETAVGRYPVETVAMMDRIIRRAEGAVAVEADPSVHPKTDDHAYVVALAARRIVESDENMRGVVCFTRSGYTALLLSKVHPNAPIYGMSPSEAVCRRLALARGVVPLHVPLATSSEEMLGTVDRVLVEGGYMAIGEEAVVVASLPVKAAGTTNFLKLHHIGESRSYG